MAGFQTKKFIKHDDYMTPFHAWGDIKEYIPNNKIIWEPFWGDGESGEHLKNLGFNVIHEDKDFFENNLGDIIVTNPPFGKSKEIMDRLLDLDKPFILIFPQFKLNTNYIRKWKNKNLQFIIPRKRIQFQKKINGEIPKNYKSKCNFDIFYYCYKMNLPKDIIWLD